MAPPRAVGRYSYRLCPSTEVPTEGCFQAHALNFSSAALQRFVNESGAVVATAAAVVLKEGTHPPRSEWARNPFPLEQGMIPPIPGLPELHGRGPFGYSVVDSVEVPRDLAPGRYVLSWRWDVSRPLFF